MTEQLKPDSEMTKEIDALREKIADLAAMVAEHERTEAMLRENEELCRAVAEDIPVLVCRYHPGCIISYVNKAYCDYFDKTADELVGTSFLSLIPEADHVAVIKNISLLTAEAPTHTHEHRVTLLGGEVRWQRWLNRALFNDHGEIVAYQSIGEDMTDRIRANTDREEALKALQAVRELEKGILQSVPHALFGVERRRIIFANEAMEAVFGWRREELIGKSTRILFRNDKEWEEYGSLLYSSLAEQPVVVFEWDAPLVRKNETEFFCRMSVSRIGSDPREGERIVATFEDITDRRLMEQKLRESEIQLRAITESAQDAILMMDFEGRISYWNPAAALLFGYSSDEVMGRNLHYALAPQRYHDSYEAAFSEFQRSGRGDAVGKTLQMTALRKGGEEFPIELSLSAVKLKDCWHAVGIIRDITKQEQLIEELKEKEHDLITESQRLLEMNTALKVLLQQRENDRQELEEMLTSNIHNLVFPFIRKLQSSPLSSVQSGYVDIIDESLNNVMSSFLSTLTTIYGIFTPREIEVAHLVRKGNTAKEIAVILNLSVRSVEFHKDKIRKKLGLTNKKINLRAKLLSL